MRVGKLSKDAFKPAPDSPKEERTEVKVGDEEEKQRKNKDCCFRCREKSSQRTSLHKLKRTVRNCCERCQTNNPSTVALSFPTSSTIYFRFNILQH